MGDSKERVKMNFLSTIFFIYQYYIYIIYSSILYYDRGRIAGIEPASSPWQREILPFNHIRNFFLPDTHAICPHIYDIYHISYMRLDHICAGPDISIF